MAIASSTILAGAAIAGLGMQAYGQIQQGQAQARAAEYNALAYKQQAESVEVARGIEIERAEREKRRLYGKQMAMIGSAGVTPHGSPMYVMLDSMTQSELDKQIINYNAESEKKRLAGAAMFAQASGAGYKASGYAGALSTTLTQGSSIGSRYFGQSKTTKEL
jgi:hypothetical protein